MTNNDFVFSDKDDKKIEKILLMLPEKEFINDFLWSLGTDASYSVEYNQKIESALSLSKGIFSNFENDLINEKYINFNEALHALYSFLLMNFTRYVDGPYVNYASLLPEWRRSADYEEVKKWEIEYKELQSLMDEVEDKYNDLLITGKNELFSNQKTVLSDYDVSFDDETAKLKIGDFNSVDFTPYTNQHLVLRKMFSVRKNEAIDWEEIYEEMSGLKCVDIDKGVIMKNQKSVKDAVRAVNNRVKEVMKTDSEVLCWEIKSVKRLY